MRRHLLASALRRLLFPLLVTCATPAFGADSATSRRAAILARVLSFELTLADRAGPSVGVAVAYKPGDAKSEANADEWMSSFNELSGLKIKDKPFFALKVASTVSDLSSAIDSKGVDLILVTPGAGADSGAIAQLTRSKRVLSASTDVSLLERGLTVCVTEVEQKLKIVINLAAADRERVRFSSQLLKLATIVRN